MTTRRTATSPPTTGSGTFSAIGTTNHILTTEPAVIAEAVLVAKDHLADLDLAVSRFRPDSEVSRLAARAADGPASAYASPVFSAYLRAALRAAALTDGLVDPTVGWAVAASGYDADMDVVRARPTFAGGAPAAVPGLEDGPHRRRHRCASAFPRAACSTSARAPRGMPRTPSRTCSRVGSRAGSSSASVATSPSAGRCPMGGWRIGIEDADGRTVQVVTSTGQAIATSSTRLRTWLAGDGTRHHIIDPRTGTTAPTTWAQVTCAAASALEANAASTAAVVLGESAPSWLDEHGIPARLDALDGSMRTTAGWPDPEEDRS